MNLVSDILACRLFCTRNRVLADFGRNCLYVCAIARLIALDEQSIATLN